MFQFLSSYQFLPQFKLQLLCFFVCQQEMLMLQRTQRMRQRIYLSISQAIDQKLISIQPFQKRINQLIDKAIDSLSQFRDQIITKANQQFDCIGLTQNQRKFIKTIKNKKIDQLTGKQMNQVLSSIDNVAGFNQKLKKIENNIHQTWNSFNQSMKTLFLRVQSYLEIFTGSTRLHFVGSSIIQTEDQKCNLLKFFDKKVIFPQLLYRASQNDFDVDIFYKKCKSINCTLVICITEYGKIIGGYNHKTWKVCRDDTRYGDQTKKSFVFSLTNNDKFTQKQMDYAFKYYSDYGPIFTGYGNGAIDFSICNRANKQKKSRASINNGFFNKNYNQGSQESWQKFSGSKQDNKFLIKQWQVWQIKFDQDQLK